MTRWHAVLLTLCCVVGCAEREAMPSRPERVGAWSLVVPSDWTRVDFDNGDVHQSQWTPPTNTQKESISVIRIDRGAARIKGTTLEQLVESSQGALKDARIARIEKLTTSHGLAGVHAQLSFTPRLKSTPYQRVQATLVDGDALIHVFYTAADPDDTLEPFTMVLDSLRRGEG